MSEDTGEKKQPALIVYRQRRMGRGPSYLEVYDTSILISLDNIIGMCDLMARKGNLIIQ